jgi:hypothetical protein
VAKGGEGGQIGDEKWEIDPDQRERERERLKFSKIRKKK